MQPYMRTNDPMKQNGLQHILLSRKWDQLHNDNNKWKILNNNKKNSKMGYYEKLSLAHNLLMRMNTFDKWFSKYS